ncbi:MAG: Gfo/Idh/MocA family protein [Armatimonadota bacterium]|jgi:predicted dehydrogenase
MSEFTAAVIGTGGIARRHAGYYTESDRVDFAAAADISDERLNAYCDTHGIERRYLDHRQMLEEITPDIVSVCTWNATHMELSMDAMRAGAKAVISEKPMGDDLGGALDAVALAEELGCYFVIGHQTRFSAGHNAAKKLLADGAIGAPVTVNVRSGGGMLNMACHLVDNMRWVIGDPAWEFVVGWLQRITNRFERGSYTEDMSHALIRFEGGNEMTLSMDMEDGVKNQNHQFVGPEGVITFNREQAVLLDADGLHDPLAIEQRGYFEELLAWMDGGPVHRNVASEAPQAQQILMAIYESAISHRRIEPPFEKRESALDEAILAGKLPCKGEPYDIRSDEALEYAIRSGEVEV